MDLVQQIKAKAAERKKTIVLPESHDPRVLQAAEIIVKEGLAAVCTIGNEDEVRSKAKELNLSMDNVKIYDPEKSAQSDDFAKIYFELRKKKGVTLEDAVKTVKRDLFYGALMVREGIVDGSVAGSTASTGDVLRAGLQCIGMPEGIATVSSFFLMVFPEKTYTFADCAVVPNPDENQLADITISTADNHRKLLGEEPYIAMLSFSTMGSAEHELVDKVRNALKIVREKRPDLKVDGEIQFDAAVVESIGKRKAPKSEVAGKANVLVFPDLNAGNIGYKIAQRMGGAEAIGPMVQGLKKPFFDLSRGCSVDDIVSTAAIAALMS